ncbi:MAG: hypothetical protein SNG27_10075 [Rikenellaceae bacterium]
MNIINDITLVDKPFSEVLTEGNYWHRTFHYHNIRQYNNIEEQLIADLNKIPIDRVITMASTFVTFRANPNSQVIIKVLGEAITQIVSQLGLQYELVWSPKNDSRMKRHAIDITLDIPMMDATHLYIPCDVNAPIK